MSIPGLGGEPAGGDVGAVPVAGHFRIYLGAAAGVGKGYAMRHEGTAGGSGAPTWLSASWNATAGR